MTSGMNRDVGTTKLCVACGTDCAERPRTKDTKGRYFCKPCFDDLLARKRRGERLTLPARRPAPPPVQRDAFDFIGIAEDSPLYDTPGADMPLAPPAPPPIWGSSAPSVVPCPTCGASLATNAALCTNCGRNIHGDRVAKTTVRRAPRPATHGVGAGDAAWRIPIGIIAIVAGSLGLVGQAINLVALDAMAEKSVALAMVVGLLVLAISLVPLVHLFGGIGLLTRNARAPGQIRLTSAIYIVLLMLAGCAAIVGSSNNPDLPPGAGGAVVAVLAMMCAWPIFTVIWFGRNAIQRQVAQW